MKRTVLTVLLLMMVLTAVPAVPVQADNTQLCKEDSFCALIALAEPAWFMPQMETSEVTLVRTGPGLTYFGYGDLPAGYRSRIVGVSVDKKWWVIPLPRAIAKDGIGWVSAESTTAKNVQSMPDWLNPCAVTNYCDYVLSNSPQQIRVMRPSETALTFGTDLR